MVVLRAEKPNPDGLDEVFHAYHALRLVLMQAVLVPNPTDRHEEAAANAYVEEALDMLGGWLAERSAEELEVSE